MMKKWNLALLGMMLIVGNTNVDIVTDVISRSITPSAGLEEPP